MLEFIYISVAVLMFFGQMKNGFFTAILTALFWPIVVVGMSLFTFFSAIYYSVKK